MKTVAHFIRINAVEFVNIALVLAAAAAFTLLYTGYVAYLIK